MVIVVTVSLDMVMSLDVVASPDAMSTNIM